MQFRPDIAPASPEIRTLLAPGGVLRAGINMSNFLLVSSRTPEGGPAGVSPDLARAFADFLKAEVRYIPYKNPGLLADAAPLDEWDIGLIGAEPQRAEVIAFTPAYSEIEATYLVPAGSPLKAVGDVDRKGVRIAVTDRTAYGLWLDRNIGQAELVRTTSIDEALEVFKARRLEALAGLRPRLISDLKVMPGATMLAGRFMAVQQAIGTPKAKCAALGVLETFVDAAKTTGFVADLIRKHGVEGLSVA
jgi:polar amino acid transport system substrate-binding protein